MGFVEWCLAIITVLFFLVRHIELGQRQERINRALDFQAPPVHGEREFASKDELKKAGPL